MLRLAIDRDILICTGNPSYSREHPYFFHFSRRLFVTTLTLDSAMAAPAIIGLSRNPVTG